MLASTDSTASCSSPSCSVSQSDVNLPHFTSCGAGWQPRTSFSLHVSIAWLDNDWILSDDREKLKCMVNDIIEELMDLDMEPKPGSLLYVQSRKWFDTSGGRQRNKLGVAVRGGV